MRDFKIVDGLQAILAHQAILAQPPPQLQMNYMLYNLQ